MAETPRNNADKRSLTRRVYDSLRADLLTGVIPPGAQLFEAELAAQYNVSKTPAREALNSLRQEGLVQVLPRRGYQVTSITLGDILALLELRSVLETGAAELAVARLSANELTELERLARASYRRGDRRTARSFIAANRAFHLGFAQLSGNPRLVDVVARCLDELERVFYLGANARNIADEVAQDHLDLVGALRRRDTAVARSIIVEHIAHTRANILRALAGGPSEITQLVEVAPVARRLAAAGGD